MDYQKETFLNTETLMINAGRQGTVKSSLPSGKRIGGVCFRCNAPCKVQAEITFAELTGAYTPYIDGVPVAEKKSPFFSLECKLGTGEHVIDLVSDGSHKGALMTVRGASVVKGEGYLAHVGGAYIPTREIAFVRPGARKIFKYERADDQTVVSEMNVSHVDAAFYYDRTHSQYTSDLVLLSASTDGEVNVITDADVKTISVNGLKDLALIDGLGLTNGADFLAAIVDGGGVMRVYAFTFGGTPSMCVGTVEGVEKVKSASRGSIFLFSDRDGVWKAMRFWSEGLETLVCGSVYMPYDVVPVTRNKLIAPTCNVNAGVSYPFYYYKKPGELLVRRNSAGAETAISYADAFIPGASEGFSISENDVSYSQ